MENLTLQEAVELGMIPEKDIPNIPLGEIPYWQQETNKTSLKNLADLYIDYQKSRLEKFLSPISENEMSIQDLFDLAMNFSPIGVTSFTNSVKGIKSMKDASKIASKELLDTGIVNFFKSIFNKITKNKQGEIATIKDLQKEVGIPKEIFDDVIFRLAKDDKIYLFKHDMPSAQYERYGEDSLVRIGDEYFNALQFKE